MRKLILVKHAPPLVQPDVPSERWTLSDRGRELCVPLADALRPLGVSSVVTSVEPKAAETGEGIAAALGVSCATAPELHEHDRSNVPHLPSREFISMVELFFRRPGELTLGRETADAVLARFQLAVNDVLQSRPTGNVAIVSHGTVIALFAARHGGGRGFDLWRRMGLPSFVVMNEPGFAVERVVEQIGR